MAYIQRPSGVWVPQGGAVRTSGSGQYLRRTANLPSSTAFTITGWGRRISAQTGTFRYFAGIESATASASDWLLIGWASSDEFQVTTSGAGGGGAFSSEPAVGQDFAWALTCSGTGSGALVGYWRAAGTNTWQTTSISGDSFTPAVVWVGNDSWDEWTDGRWWNVKCWNRVLSQKELYEESLYSQPIDTNRLNFWAPLNTSKTLWDYSGNGRHLTAGGTLTTEARKTVLRERTHKVWIGYSASAGTSITTGLGELTLTGFAPSLNDTVNVGLGQLELTGFAPSLSRGINPGLGALTLTGFAPSLTVTENVSNTPGLGDLVLSSSAPTVQTSASGAISTGLGELTLTGFAPKLDYGLNTGLGELTLTGFAPTLAVTANQFSAPGLGELALSSSAPTLTVTANQFSTPDVGLLELIGFAPSVQAQGSYSLTTDLGTLILTGFQPDVSGGEGAPKTGAGKARRRRRILVEVDGEVFDASSESEALKILETLREEAQKVAEIAVSRAVKAKNRPVRKILADARKTLAAPTIKSEGISVADTQKEIEKLYQDALQTIEIAAMLKRQDDEDEEIIVLL